MSHPKLFAGDTSPFSVFKNTNASDIDLNNDLKKIGEWAFQKEMNFNPDPAKQVQELFFSRKVQMINHPPFFQSKCCSANSLQKHIEMFSDSK